MTEAERIAAGLSKAQRRAVLDLEATYAATEALAQLYQDGLASISKAAGIQSMELTELGSAVRAILLKGTE